MGIALVLDCDCIIRPDDDTGKTWTLTQRPLHAATWTLTQCPLHAAAPKLLEACIQARGALILDHMVDDKGEPYGTTTVALEYLQAAIAEAEPVKK